MIFRSMAVLLALASPVLAETHEVKMLNRNDTGVMVYEPDFLTVAPGDTIRFVATNPTHNAETIPEMLPEGAEPFRSKINQDFEVTLTEEGVYGVKCTPHYAMGMVMLIEVGTDQPITLPERLPRGVQKRFQEILERAGREAS